jgi:dienelactone hydrolase
MKSRFCIEQRCALSFAFGMLLAVALRASDLIDDRAITIKSAQDVAVKRQALVDFLWGVQGFPGAKLPSSVTKNIPTPVSGLNNLKRVDELHVAMDEGEQALAYHFVAKRSNGRLVVVHQGHGCTFDDRSAPVGKNYGMRRAIDELLSAGFSVLAVYMPHEFPGDCRGTAYHNSMLGRVTAPASPMRFFLEPVAVCLNYLQAKSRSDHFPKYREFDMAGFSGGGWTTTVYAAIDPRITMSFPVAGSLPLYLRTGASVGDAEQTFASLYKIAGYPDLYVMGASGAGRKQVQILNRRDSCCFGEKQHDAAQLGITWEAAVRSYETEVRNTLDHLASRGSFRVAIDEESTGHMISHHAIADEILPELSAKH